MIIHNGQFAECEVLENFQGFCCPRTMRRTSKLFLENPEGQGLSLRITTLVGFAFYYFVPSIATVQFEKIANEQFLTARYTFR